MARLVCARFEAACRGLLDRRLDLLESVEAGDNIIDALQIEIDEASVEAIAMIHPCATDLRAIVASMRAATELERIGDEAVNLAGSGAELLAQPACPHISGVRLLMETAEGALSEAVRGWRRGDPARARRALQQAERVRGLQDALTDQLLDTMQSDPTLVESCVSLTLVARSVGRVAWHASRLAREALFVRPLGGAAPVSGTARGTR